jgi:ribosomal protein L40E
MRQSSDQRSRSKDFETKKCPECYAYLPGEAVRCNVCGTRVGKRGKTGMAIKPINWKAYTICLFAWVAFGLYVWWAFFKEN